MGYLKCYAVNQFNGKRSDSGEAYRYKGNTFENFYNVSTTSKEMLGLLSSAVFYEEKSELENLINSSNSFVDKLALGEDNYINESEFSVLA